MQIMVLQFEIKFGDVNANIKKIESLLQDTEIENSNIIVLPELWTTGYDLENINKLATDNLEPMKTFIQKLAKEYNINIVAGSVMNKKSEGIMNTSFVVNRNGECIHEYSKIHLVPMMKEPEYMVGGNNKASTFELDGVNMGVLICYDLRFPELFRRLALGGAKIIYVVAEWPIERTNQWLTLLKARAIENQCFIVASNIVGKQPIGAEFAGNSIIIDALGNVIEKADSKEETVLFGRINLGDIKKVRSEVPIFTSRRPEIY
ncbi:hydrolase [Oceanobacillus oncorhynchi subsp. incaldanensis]|uniref:carbon-nitrogen family hydrolase n=1 Tax=Oceanobacillus oncorhynchi TaxID=545501 RepID=UPI001B241A15|nr:carbon-nitrogen family hydrolase [Oceanobacillus oncorhynchi]GIO20273.1 hydrolase [Oceanobacillus oncorhynchi subsp. incaldanensis]